MKYLFRFLKKYLHLVLLSILTSLCLSGCSVFLASMIKDIINNAQAHQLGDTQTYIMKGIVVLVVGVLCSFLTEYIIGYFGSYATKDMKEQATQHLLKLKIEFVEKNTTGDIISRFANDINFIQSFIENYFGRLIESPISIIFFSAYLIYLNPKLYFISFIIVPFCAFATIKLLTKLKQRQRDYLKYLGTTNNTIQELSNQNSTIKSFSLENILLRKYESQLKKATEMALKNDATQTATSPLFTIAYMGPLLISYGVGTYFCIKGELTLGALIAFSQLISQAIGPCMKLHRIYSEFKLTSAAIERVFFIFEEPTENDEAKDTLVDVTFKNAVEFKNVCFAYDDTDILKNINFTIEAGKTVAIVGASGSGKSTIINALLKFYELKSGEIKLYGKNIAALSIETVRNYFSYVSQSTFLFPLSIQQNIAIGKNNATTEEIFHASKLAFADDFIANLPQKYETILGERGTKLSGGQVQRIAIARAFLKDAPIMILDEATASLDNDSEFYIKEALQKYKANKTILVIAHRLSTIKDADFILVLDKGTIAETGTHHDLMQHGVIYKELYHQYVEAEV